MNALIEKYKEHVLLSFDFLAARNGSGNIYYPKNWIVPVELAKLPDSYLIVIYYSSTNKIDVFGRWLERELGRDVLFINEKEITVSDFSRISTSPWSMNFMRVRLENFPGFVADEAFPVTNPFDKKYRLYMLYAPDHQDVKDQISALAMEVNGSLRKNGKTGELLKESKTRPVIIDYSSNPSFATLAKVIGMLNNKSSVKICIVAMTGIPTVILDTLPFRKKDMYQNIEPEILNYPFLRYLQFHKVD